MLRTASRATAQVQKYGWKRLHRNGIKLVELGKSDTLPFTCGSVRRSTSVRVFHFGLSKLNCLEVSQEITCDPSSRYDKRRLEEKIEG